MQERRFRLIELAIQGGATIDNATKVASDWEDWIDSDDGFLADPLRLGVPGPSPNGLLDEIDNFKEIYWSRPQILIGHNANHGQLVMTNGEHGSWNFTGKLLSKNGFDCGSAFSNCWPKSNFTYHGEIPEEPANSGGASTRRVYIYPDGDETSTVFVSRLGRPELFDAYNNGKKHSWYIEDYVKTLDAKLVLLPNFLIDGEITEP